MRRTRSREMIPMSGQVAPSAGSAGRAEELVRQLIGRMWGTPSILIPMTIIGIMLLVGLVVGAQSMGKSNESSSPHSTNPRAPLETSVARGSGWLNEILVSSIVQIVLMENGTDCTVGSGSVIGDRLHVITNHHVIAGGDRCTPDRISVRTASSASSAAVETYVGKVVASSDSSDVAILELTPVVTSAPELIPLQVVSTDEIGQDITVVGYPAIGGDSATVSRGILSGYAEFDGLQWIKTDALISGGNSGGAALDAKGRLLGIPTMYSQSTSGEVVDCRNAADTNGDGRIDGRDQCVTTGGTIGLVAPASAFISIAREAGLKVTVEH